MTSITIKAPSNLIRIPKTRQATNYTCGVAALQSILYYFGDEYREDRLAEQLRSGPDWGTAYTDIVKFSESLGYKVNVKTGWTIEELKKAIDSRHPVIVAFQAWPDDEPSDWKLLQDDGHYSVVIGYDADNFFFMDPSTLGNYTYIPQEEFLDRWHDTDGRDLTLHVDHLGLEIWKDHPKYDSDEILRLK